MLPASLRMYWSGPAQVELEATTLAAAVAELERRSPGLGARIVDEQGRLRRYVHVFVNQEPVSHLPPDAVTLRPGDVVHILPSVAGG